MDRQKDTEDGEKYRKKRLDRERHEGDKRRTIAGRKGDS